MAAVAVLALRACPGLLRLFLVVWGFHTTRTTTQSLAHASGAGKVGICIIRAALCDLRAAVPCVRRTTVQDTSGSDPGILLHLGLAGLL